MVGQRRPGGGVAGKAEEFAVAGFLEQAFEFGDAEGQQASLRGFAFFESGDFVFDCLSVVGAGRDFVLVPFQMFLERAAVFGALVMLCRAGGGDERGDG